MTTPLFKYYYIQICKKVKNKVIHKIDAVLKYSLGAAFVYEAIPAYDNSGNSHISLVSRYCVRRCVVLKT